MELPKNERIAVLQEFNPWWSGRVAPDLPDWERTAMGPIREWMGDTDSKRALVLSGARQTGKTSLLRQETSSTPPSPPPDTQAGGKLP